MCKKKFPICINYCRLCLTLTMLPKIKVSGIYELEENYLVPTNLNILCQSWIHIICRLQSFNW